MAAEKVVRVRFDGTTKGLLTASKEAAAQVKAFQATLDEGKKNLASFGAGVNTATGHLVALAMKISALAGVMNIFMLLAGGAITLSGALPLAVAGLGALAAVMITSKLGADGVKRAFEGLTPTLNNLKSEVSSSFEKSLTPAVNNLKVVLPQLTSGFKQIATASGGVATRFTAMLSQSKNVAGLNTILGGTAKIVDNIGKFLAPVGQAFITLGATAMPILVQLTGGLGNAGEKFNAWVQRMADSGNITQWIHNALDLFRQIGDILGDVGAIIRSVFGALTDAGVGLGGVFGPIVKQVRAFVESAEGHDAIVGLAQAIGTVGAAVGQVLGAALKAVAPAIPALAQAFAGLATQAAAVLVPAINMLAPVLLGLATFLQQNIAWVGPLVLGFMGLIPVIQGIVAAINIWKAATAAFQVIQVLLNTTLLASPITWVVAAIAGLIAIIILVCNNLDFFRGLWDAVWKFCSDVITNVVGFFRNVWNAAFSWVQGAISNVGSFFGNVFNGIRGAVGSVTDWFRNAWNNAVSAVRGVFQGLADFAGGIWDGIAGAAKSAINAVIRVINGAIGGVNAVTGVVGVPSIPKIPMLAKGGTAQSGRTYLVGEKGPELFTPGRTGRVTNARTTAEAIGGSASTINLTLDLGAGIQEVVQIQLDENNRHTARLVTSGMGAAR